MAGDVRLHLLRDTPRMTTTIDQPDQIEQIDPWPLRGLVVRTPRLELRPARDTDVAELAVLACGPVEADGSALGEHEHGLHGAELARGLVTQFWRHRADFSATAWQIDFAVIHDQRLIGVQSLTAQHFTVAREVSTSSWLARSAQNQGLGTEMRAAVLDVAFDALEAEQARSTVTAAASASKAVSVKLGYRSDGTDHLVRGGTHLVRRTRLLLTRSAFGQHRPRWRPEITGLEPCLPLLGT